MIVAYSQDLRDRILASYDAGLTTKDIAETFQVSRPWARRVNQRRREHGETAPWARGGAKRLIFIDETRAKTNMTRLRGRALRGQRVIDKTPHGHWKTTTLIAALGIEGMRCSTVVDGAVNGNVFEAFVEHVLVPELREGDIVIMDNLSSHKSPRIRTLIESAGARLQFLPPYSPDLNPIEMIFSKIKQALRSMACRTRDALWSAMQGVLDRVTPSDAINCFRHCRYPLRLH